MEALCPQCRTAMTTMENQRDIFCCALCHTHYQQQVLCPQCQQPLQILKACGAVDYFCNHGHGLVSKKTVQLRYQRV